MTNHDDFSSWGRLISRPRDVISADGFETPGKDQSFLPFGNGRSYGDSCHNDAGLLVDLRNRCKILDFDVHSGMIRCEAGTLLVDLISAILPHGYFLPVTPGTRYVTVGGAIANDVHGKNHHKHGTFGCHVESFSLRRSDGSVFNCSKHENEAFYSATIGGMGLTGLIGEATIRLMRVPSADVCQRTIRLNSLDDYFSLIEGVDKRYDYSVAWIDQLARGKHLGRGTLMAANHVESEKVMPPQPPRFSIPFQPPVNLLNHMTLKAFNALYFRRAKSAEAIVPWASYFYPLDAIGRWNRLYGPRGLYQHQSVYPLKDAPEITRKLLECCQAHRHASFLTVLKRFGNIRSPGLMSFVREGITLTLDFANNGAATLTLLEALDKIVLEADGAVNPYKDARMSAQCFARSFAHWQKLEEFRDPQIISNFWQRTAKSLPINDINNTNRA